MCVCVCVRLFSKLVGYIAKAFTRHHLRYCWCVLWVKLLLHMWCVHLKWIHYMHFIYLLYILIVNGSIVPTSLQHHRHVHTNVYLGQCQTCTRSCLAKLYLFLFVYLFLGRALFFFFISIESEYYEASLSLICICFSLIYTV